MITVNEIAGEDIPGLRIEQLILAVQIPARSSLFCVKRNFLSEIGPIKLGLIPETVIQEHERHGKIFSMEKASGTSV